MTRSARALLSWLALAAVATMLVAARAAAPAGAQATEPSGAELELGRLVYANQCAACHGSAAQGGTVPGTGEEVPPLADNPDVTVAYLDLVMRVGRMPPPVNDPFDNRGRNVVVTDDERAAVIAVLVEDFGVDGEVIVPPPGDAARGREVFATNCAQCHGSTGAGGVAGGGAWTPSLHHLDPIAVAEAIRVGPFEMPAFSDEVISDEEMGDVAAFLAFVDAEKGTPLGLVELNPVFASGFAALLTLAVILAILGLAGRPTWFPDPERRRNTEEDD